MSHDDLQSPAPASAPVESSPFLVDPILPKHEIHLIFGPSSQDCTLLALTLADDWAAGRAVFGYPSHPLPFVYVACERSLASLRRSMRILDMDHHKIPHVSLIGATSPEDHNLGGAINLARGRVPNLRVLFLDGLLSLCSGRINDYKESSKFLRETVATCHHERITIVGCMSTSKSKDGSGYTSALDRMHGSTAWQSATHTKILIDPNRPNDPRDTTRSVTLIPDILPPKMFQYSRADGPLICTGDGIFRAGLDAWLAAQEPGKEITAHELRMVADSLNLSSATLYRWLHDQIELGTIVKSKHGTYTVSDRIPS